MIRSERYAVVAVPLLFLGASVLGGCSKPAQPAAQPAEVKVVVVESRPLTNTVELPGRVQAVRTAEVRARVDGIVQRRLYNEGTDVSAGKELFLIDPSQLIAGRNAAQAALARAEATAANAAQDVARYKGLVAEEAISKQEYDAAMARMRTADADVAQTRAQLETAGLSLGYTRVTSPISGRAGRAQVTEGALVSATAGTLLTTVEQLDPIYVNFSQSSSDLLAIRREITAGTLKVPELGRVAVHVELEDGSEYEHSGHLDFLDLSIEEATGTAALRAELPNPDRKLLPGQFVRARIDAGERPNGVLIPQRAVRVTPQGASVMIVGADGKVANRPVVTGSLQGDLWLILNGLRNGDRVIVDGIQKVQPGQPVRIAAAEAKPAAGAPAGPAPGAAQEH
ncbi:MAG TPA: efflux RND transporter periplasmic adaptor subunit [Steroidobacteraceae bacterium]